MQPPADLRDLPADQAAALARWCLRAARLINQAGGGPAERKDPVNAPPCQESALTGPALMTPERSHEHDPV